MPNIKVIDLPEKVGNVVNGDVMIVQDSEDGNKVKRIDALKFKGEEGDQGIQGVQGKGISGIALLSTVGLVKTYRITYTDATTQDYVVTDGTNGTNGTNGNGISGITLLSTVGLVKTYRITYTNGTTFDYFTTDGAAGSGTGTGDMLKSENLSGLANTATARINLGAAGLSDANTFTLNVNTPSINSLPLGLGAGGASSNVAIGSAALNADVTSSETVAIGGGALSGLTTGFGNIAVGPNAGFGQTSGDKNILLGKSALGYNGGGASNIAIGSAAGTYTSTGNNTTSTNSVYIGEGSKAAGASQTNQIVIGGGAVGNGSNTVTIGDNSITETHLKGSVVSPTITSPVVNVTSDATGDIYYRNAGGAFTRLPIGTTGQVLTETSGVPSWQTPTGGGGGGGGFEGIALTATAGWTIQSQSDTLFPLNTVVGPVNTNYNTSTYEYTVGETGVYECLLALCRANGGGTNRYIDFKIFVNGTSTAEQRKYYQFLSLETTQYGLAISLTAGDVITFRARALTNSINTRAGGSYSTILTFKRIN